MLKIAILTYFPIHLNGTLWEGRREKRLQSKLKVGGDKFSKLRTDWDTITRNNVSRELVNYHQSVS